MDFFFVRNFVYLMAPGMAMVSTIMSSAPEPLSSFWRLVVLTRRDLTHAMFVVSTLKYLVVLVRTCK